MNCPKCGESIGIEDAIPKSVVRKWLNDLIENAEDADIKIRALSELNKLEQYTGSGMKKDQKKLGVFIVQSSSFLKKGPGKNVEDGGGIKSS